MPTLIFVRHGVKLYDNRGYRQTFPYGFMHKYDAPLHPRQPQLQHTVDALNDLSVFGATIISSPFQRTRDTAFYINQFVSGGTSPLLLDVRLGEYLGNQGRFFRSNDIPNVHINGLTESYFRGGFMVAPSTVPDEMKERVTNISVDETVDEMEERLQSFLDSLLSDGTDPESVFIIVSHGFCIETMLRLLGREVRGRVEQGEFRLVEI